MNAPTRIALAAIVVAAAACDAPQAELMAPTAADEARSARADCRATPLSTVTTGEVTTDDCVFDNGGTTQYEDLYLVNQRRLGMDDLSGANMLTFTGDADFDAIFGVGSIKGRDVFPNPVYGYTNNTSLPNSFSIIASGPIYKMWFGGQGPSQLGEYTVTTSTEPSASVCETGRLVFIQGDVQFTSGISDATSCQGTVQFGPNQGLPLNYQYWYYKLLPGETINLTLTGLDPDPTVVLAAIGGGQALLDFSDSPGDTDRAVTFTATNQIYLYVEVSSAPGVTSGYTLTVDGP